ncbi:Hemolysins or related protein containing CBS domains [Halapricum desulfuricans]|uniref:Hemolysins or related protein containing CBS domains n=1 Tax=Halapricum desulfuricans TaxID=2841257 RepID=A0A897NNQ4_9EURY|nr:hemolysin family protein [Halapricum desulfuricans]QSG12479.1 Hemolysins or related protein containing CBS domains [Halapricum desulfuricans]
MESLELTVRLVAGVALILTNGFFVAIEFALTRARQFTEAEFLGDGSNAGLRRAWEMTQDLELYLTTCQVGITASSIAVGIVAEPALAALFEPIFENTALASIGSGAILAFLIINLVHLTHGEQTPTYLGVERSRWVSKYGAVPLYWFHWLISPIITLGDGIAKLTLKLFGVEMTGAWLETEEDVIESRADLRNRVGSALEEGGLTEERRDEVMNALKIGEQPIREEMVDAEEIVALSTAVDPAENFRLMEEHPHSRYPLIGEELIDIEGIVYLPALSRYRNELAAGEVEFAELAAPPMTLSPDVDVSDAVDQFQAENQELALVIEDGEVVGMVTVTDLLESVMGDVDDPIDTQYLTGPDDS